MRILFLVFVWLSAVVLIAPTALYRRVDTVAVGEPISPVACAQADLASGSVSGMLEEPREEMPSDKPPAEEIIVPSTIDVGAFADETDTEPAAPPVSEPTTRDDSVILQISDRGSGYTVSLGEYLVGVVMAEMPASFHKEALRAQAVAARSYLLYRRDRGYPIYDWGSSCTAYFTEAEGRAFFGDAYDAVKEIIRAAVADTDGEVLFYDGEIICAAYHAMSYGYTTDGADVWGGDTPYLTSVITPEQETISGLVMQYAFDEETLCRMLSVECALPFSVEYTAHGRLASVTTASGVYFSGERFRSLLRLRSTAAEITAQDAASVSLCVRGYGHGVGMSQYGADLYADAGWSYRAILSHYYPQTTLGLLS